MADTQPQRVRQIVQNLETTQQDPNTVTPVAAPQLNIPNAQPNAQEQGIPAQAITGVEPQNIPLSTPGSLEGVLARGEAAIASGQRSVDQNQQNVDIMEQRVRQLQDTTMGRGDFRRSLEEDSGIGEATDTLQGVLDQIVSRTNALEKSQLKDEQNLIALEGRGMGIPLAVVRGQQARLAREQSFQRRADAADINALTRSANLLQNNLSQAKADIDRMVTEEFADREKAVKNELFFLSRLDTKLEGAKSDLARQKERQLNVELRQIDNERQDFKDAQNLAIELTKNGAPANMVQEAANARNVGDIMKIGGSGKYFRSIKERLSESLIRSQIANQNLKNSELKKSIEAASQSAASGYYQLTGKEDFKSAGFAKRMYDAQATIERLTAQGVDLKPKKVAEDKNFGLSKQERELKTAYREFISAKLRKESGAAISAEEYLNEGKNLVYSNRDTESNLDIKLNSMQNSIAATVAESQGGFEYLQAQDLIGTLNSTDVGSSVVSARTEGYGDQDIIGYMTEAYPDFSEQINRAYSLGASPEEIALQMTNIGI